MNKLVVLYCLIVFKKCEELLDVLLTDFDLWLFCVGGFYKGLFKKPHNIHQPEEREEGKAT